MIVDAWDDPDSRRSRTSVSDRAERALLGALLITNDVAAAAGLTPAMFRSKQRGAAFAAMQEAGAEFDALTLAARLENCDVPAPGGDWVVALAACLDDTSADLARQYARIIKEAAVERRAEARRAGR